MDRTIGRTLILAAGLALATPHFAAAQSVPLPSSTGAGWSRAITPQVDLPPVGRAQGLVGTTAQAGGAERGIQGVDTRPVRDAAAKGAAIGFAGGVIAGVALGGAEEAGMGAVLLGFPGALLGAVVGALVGSASTGGF